MDFKALRLIKKIYETKNITKASENLYMSQPTLTYHIRQLEKSLGFDILIRQPKGVKFSEKGVKLAQFAERVLLEWDNLEKEFKENDLNSILNIGLSTVISKLKFPQLLQNYNKQYEKIPLNIYTGSSTLDIPKMLEQKKLDMAILRGTIQWSGCTIVLKKEPFYIISSQEIDLTELPKYPWVCYKASKITKNNLQLEKWWNTYFKPSHSNIINLNSIEATIEMVKHGLGWAVIPEIYLESCEGLSYKIIEFPDGKKIYRNTTLAYQPELDKHSTAMNFINYIIKNYDLK